jgi:nucleoside-diphosphate-sugar epimerase
MATNKVPVSLLITGGAGFIGSNLVAMLCDISGKDIEAMHGPERQGDV